MHQDIKKKTDVLITEENILKLTKSEILEKFGFEQKSEKEINSNLVDDNFSVET
jgi:hypothetical protein